MLTSVCMLDHPAYVHRERKQAAAELNALAGHSDVSRGQQAIPIPQICMVVHAWCIAYWQLVLGGSLDIHIVESNCIVAVDFATSTLEGAQKIITPVLQFKPLILPCDLATEKLDIEAGQC